MGVRPRESARPTAGTSTSTRPSCGASWTSGATNCGPSTRRWKAPGGCCSPWPRSARHAAVRAAGRARRGAGVNAVAPIRTPPGRAGRQHLLHRLAVAARGAGGGRDLVAARARPERGARLVLGGGRSRSGGRHRPLDRVHGGAPPLGDLVHGPRTPRRAQPHRATPPWSTPRPPTGKRYGPPPTTPAHGRPPASSARRWRARAGGSARSGAIGSRARRRHWPTWTSLRSRASTRTRSGGGGPLRS